MQRAAAYITNAFKAWFVRVREIIEPLLPFLLRMYLQHPGVPGDIVVVEIHSISVPASGGRERGADENRPLSGGAAQATRGAAE